MEQDEILDKLIKKNFSLRDIDKYTDIETNWVDDWTEEGKKK